MILLFHGMIPIVGSLARLTDPASHPDYPMFVFFAFLLCMFTLLASKRMAFKIPAKRRRRPSADTPTVTPSSRRSSLLARSSPIHASTEHTQKRVSLVPRDYHKGSTAWSSRAASIPPSEVDVVSQQFEANEREVDESNDEIVMAVDMRDRASIGCCYYVAAKETLYLMADIKSAGLDIIDLRKRVISCILEQIVYFLAVVKLRIEPTVILLSMRVDEGVDSHLDPGGRRRGSINGDGTEPYDFRYSGS